MIPRGISSKKLLSAVVLHLRQSVLPSRKIHYDLRCKFAARFHPVSQGLAHPSLSRYFCTTAPKLKKKKPSRRSKRKKSRRIEIDEGAHIDTYKTREEPPPLDEGLSEEQRHVFNLVIKEGKSIFFTGPAGTGKSFLLERICNGLIKEYYDRTSRHSKVAITASTGLAAHHIGGVTLHSFAGIGLGTTPTEVLIKKICGLPVSIVYEEENANKRHWKKVRSRWRHVRVLVIDEISMINAELFDKLDRIGRAVRGVDEPFGGIQLVLSGDFYRLPPVTPDLDDESPRFCFEAQAWKTAIQHTIELTHVYRQKDPNFARMLNAMREGSLSPEAIVTFKKLDRPIQINRLNQPEPTHLFPLRRQADSTNQSRLDALVTQTYTYTASEGGIIQDESIRKTLLSHFIAPKVLELKEGAWVMLVRNREDGRINGSQGRVVGFGKRGEFPTWGRPHEVESVEGDPEDEEPLYPLVRFESKDEDLDPDMIEPQLIEPEKWEVLRWVQVPPDEEGAIRDPDDEDECWKVEVLASRIQVPLTLAWALSIHKSQGQSLDYVKVDLRHVFEAGQAYVALSRAKTLEGLQVLNFNPSKITVHPKVKEFYRTLSRGKAQE